MTRAREAVAAEFLRKALAAEPLGVPKLNAMARAAGFLSERQRITDAKVFRRAKILLRIRSIRDGFGASGGWAWELPRHYKARVASPSSIGPRLLRYERPVPREWVEGVARLEQNRPLADIPRHRWRQFVEDCFAFLRSEELAERAARLGWDAVALFGCRHNYPLAYLGNAGLLWQVDGGRVVEVHRGWAVIERPVSRSQRIFSRRDVDPQKIALPWMLNSVTTGYPCDVARRLGRVHAIRPAHDPASTHLIKQPDQDRE